MDYTTVIIYSNIITDTVCCTLCLQIYNTRHRMLHSCGSVYIYTIQFICMIECVFLCDVCYQTVQPIAHNHWLSIPSINGNNSPNTIRHNTVQYKHLMSELLQTKTTGIHYEQLLSNQHVSNQLTQ